MDVTINIFGVGGIVILAIIIGYFMGRSRCEILPQEGETESAAERRIVGGKTIVSPVAGKLSFFCEDGRRGIVIEPDQGMIYAPVSGKIIKVYPMGNAFLLQFEEQGEVMELMIQVGRSMPDELSSMYYRPRVVQNEIVSKGKLLLVFDKEHLRAAGEDVSVFISSDTGMYEDKIMVTQKENVKVGEELYCICQ